MEIILLLEKLGLVDQKTLLNNSMFQDMLVISHKSKARIFMVKATQRSPPLLSTEIMMQVSITQMKLDSQLKPWLNSTKVTSEN